MDLSITVCSQQNVKGEKEQQQEVTNEHRNHIFKSKETFIETDFEGNNNFSNDTKTEVTNNHGHGAGSLSGDEMCESEEKFELLRKISTCKKAIDLSIHNRTSDGGEKTIFDDAEYFSRNYSYKLLPINFENVNETIIHMEHNYCHLSLSSGSDAEVDCSRTIDYNQVKQKNYKKRRERFKETVADDKLECKENTNDHLAWEYLQQNKMEPLDFHVSEEENCSLSGEPLDLSAPLVQDKKTDNYIEKYPTSIVEDYKDDSAQFDSDKENQKSNVNFVEVTIARKDGKENYQPCDLFLNDIANLVPKLIQKDCCEIDILDCTCDSYLDFHKHRLYYVISQSTWRLFQSANERVILTNDKSLGQPLQKLEKDEKPTYLVFDQYSLAKSLAEYCKEIGGCFEYTFVEESKDDSTEKLSEIHVESEKPKKDSDESLECDLKLTKVEEFSQYSKNRRISSPEKNIEETKTEPECKISTNGDFETEEKTMETSHIEDGLSTVNLEKDEKDRLSDVMKDVTFNDKCNSERDENSKETILKEVECENSIVEKNLRKHRESNRKVVEKVSSLAETKATVQTAKAKKEDKIEKPAGKTSEESTETISARTRFRKSNLESSESEKRNLRKFKKGTEEEKEKSNIISKSNDTNNKNNNDSYMKTRSKSTSESEVVDDKVEIGKFITSQISVDWKEPSKRGTKCKLSLSEDREKTVEKTKTNKRKISLAEISSLSELQSKRKAVAKKESDLVRCSRKRKSVETRHGVKDGKKVKNSKVSAKENLSNSKSNEVLIIKKESAKMKVAERKSAGKRTKGTKQNHSRSENSRNNNNKNKQNKNSKRGERVEKKKDNNRKVLSKGKRKR